MRTIIFAFLFITEIIFSNIFAQNQVIIDSYQKELEHAYKNKSTSELNIFLTKWNNSLKPNFPTNNYNNDTIRNIHEIYREFYKPFDLLKLGDWEWGNKLNSNSKFALIQHRLYYNIVSLDNLREGENKFKFEVKKEDILKADSIIGFRPNLTFENHKILYLTPEYKIALNKFLGTQSGKFGKPNIMHVSRPRKQSEKRYQFIRPYLPILHGHWGGYWHFETAPRIYEFYMNKTFDQAKILYVVGYQGGEAFLIKKDAKWILKESKATWIE